MPRISKKAGSYHHGELRRALLEAAVRVVEKDGVSALTLQALARRAGVSSGAPYHHFQNREQLLAAIAQEGLSLLVEEMKREASSGCVAGASEHLAALGRGYVRFALSHRGHFRVMFRPELRGQLGKDLSEALGEGLTMLKQAVARCQDEGVAPPGDSLPYVLLAWSAVHGASALWIDGSLSDEAFVEDGDALAATIASTLVGLFRGASERRG